MNWWYLAGEEQKGPFNETELKGLIVQGMLSPDTLLWREGWEDWKKIGEVEEFKAPVVSAPVALPVVVKHTPSVSHAEIAEAISKTSEAEGEPLGNQKEILDPLTEKEPIKSEASAGTTKVEHPESKTITSSAPSSSVAPESKLTAREAATVVPSVFPWKWAIVGTVVVLGLSIFFITKKGEVPATETIEEVSADSLAWTNPITGKKVEFPKAWKVTKTKGKGDTLDVYHLRHSDGKKQMDIGGAKYPQDSIEQYVGKYKESVKSEMDLEIAGKVYMDHGFLHWEGGGVMAKDKNRKVKIHIVKIEQEFWRTVMIREELSEEELKELNDLERSFWASFIK